MIRVVMPYHLRNLSGAPEEIALEVEGVATVRTVLDALEAKYPMLRGNIRDYETGRRRPFLRFFVCQQDWSLESPDAELPNPVLQGQEPFLIIGAIAGG